MRRPKKAVNGWRLNRQVRQVITAGETSIRAISCTAIERESALLCDAHRLGVRVNVGPEPVKDNKEAYHSGDVGPEDLSHHRLQIWQQPPLTLPSSLKALSVSVDYIAFHL